MKPDKLWEETGRMLLRAQREEVTEGQARERLGTWLRQKAAGGEPADLTVETVWVLGEPDSELNSELPEELCKLLGLELGSEYGDIFNAMYLLQHPAH